MPRNGSGTFIPPSNSWNPQVTGALATPADFAAQLADLSNALSQSVSNDGQTPIVGNIPMGNNKLTGLAAGTGTGDSLRWEQLFSQGTEQTIASAATVDIGAQNTTFLNVTGTTTITSFGTNYNGPRYLRFSGAVQITNSATLICPGSANILTSAGDILQVNPKSTVGTPDGWVVTVLFKANGFPASVVTGLFAQNDGTNPTTKYVVSRTTSCTYRSAGGASFTSFSQASLTCDITQAGPIINGRDQAAAFSASTWLHLYKISDGVTEALIMSTALPSVGPTFPTGYMYAAYIGPIYFTAGSQLTTTTMSGADATLDFSTTIVSDGTSTVETQVTSLIAIPPVTVSPSFKLSVQYRNLTEVAGTYSAVIRVRSGAGFINLAIGVPSNGAPAVNTLVVDLPNINQGFRYASGSANTGVTLTILGYKINNGG